MSKKEKVINYILDSFTEEEKAMLPNIDKENILNLIELQLSAKN